MRIPLVLNLMLINLNAWLYRVSVDSLHFTMCMTCFLSTSMICVWRMWNVIHLGCIIANRSDDSEDICNHCYRLVSQITDNVIFIIWPWWLKLDRWNLIILACMAVYCRTLVIQDIYWNATIKVGMMQILQQYTVSARHQANILMLFWAGKGLRQCFYLSCDSNALIRS